MFSIDEQLKMKFFLRLIEKKNNQISEEEFEIFIKQISYSRYLREKKVDSQLMTNQYITNLVRSFKK